jgi:hypothetical protein
MKMFVAIDFSCDAIRYLLTIHQHYFEHARAGGPNNIAAYTELRVDN